MSEPAIDRDEAFHFLNLLAESEPVTFQTFDDCRPAREGRARILQGELDDHVDTLERLNADGTGVFTMVNRGNGHGRDTQSVTGVRAVFADLDGAPLEPVYRCGLEPHIVVESSPSRYHAYWLVDDLPLERFKGVQQAIIQRFGADPSVHDLPRVMRLPGFLHRKYEPFFTHIIHDSGAQAYSAAQILETFSPAQSERAGPRLGPDHDDVLRALDGRGLIQRQLAPGKWQITCPWAGEHTHGDTTGSVYFEAHSNGYAGAAFKCQHGHCAERTIDDLRVWLGIEPARSADYVPLDLSHDSLAIRLSSERLKGDAQYVASWGRWMLWSGARWETDERLKHMTLVRSFLRETANGLDNDKQARDLRSDATRAAVERMVRSNAEVAASADQWDADPWLAGTPGGTIDLRTGSLRKAQRRDYITRLTAVAPAKAGTDAPLWRAFLQRIFRTQPEIIPFLQRAAGYALTGKTTEHKLIFGFGTGRNGKGTFFNTLTSVLGNYATVAPSATFLESGADHHPTDLASLAGARLVTASELPPGKTWNESRIKSLTGGDPITARWMRQDFFTFEPQFALMIAGNHLPSFRGVDEATRARVLLVPFTEVIPPHERDLDLGDKLRDEWPAILRWAIDGALAWQAQGLNAPERVQAASAEYLESEDMLGEYIGDRLRGLPGGFLPTNALYDDFRAWCQDRGMHAPWTQHALTRAMTERGYTLNKRNIGRGLLGFALVDNGAYERAKQGR